MQLGRFEEFDAFGQFAAQMAFGVFQSFFGDVACAVVEDGVEHGCVAVIAGNFDFVDGDEACAWIFQAGADEFGQFAHDLFFDTVLAGVAALGFSHGFP